jgi:hypothetical protein
MCVYVCVCVCMGVYVHALCVYTPAQGSTCQRGAKSIWLARSGGCRCPLIGRSLGGRSSRTSLTPRSTADDLIFKRQNTLPHPTGVITMDWESTGSLLPWSLLPWSLLPWSLLPWSLLPWSLLPGSLLPWSLLPWSLLPWSLLPWSQHSQPWFSESWASSIKSTRKTSPNRT